MIRGRGEKTLRLTPFGRKVIRLGSTPSASSSLASELLATTYVLEVSSPGVDRPLTEPRHWRRNVRRLVTATPVEGEPVTGRVLSADDAAVVLDVDGAERRLPYAEVVRGNVQVEFSRKDEDGPELDETTDEDDEEGAP